MPGSAPMAMPTSPVASPSSSSSSRNGALSRSRRSGMAPSGPRLLALLAGCLAVASAVHVPQRPVPLTSQIGLPSSTMLSPVPVQIQVQRATETPRPVVGSEHGKRADYVPSWAKRGMHDVDEDDSASSSSSSSWASPSSSSASSHSDSDSDSISASASTPTSSSNHLHVSVTPSSSSSSSPSPSPTSATTTTFSRLRVSNSTVSATKVSSSTGSATPLPTPFDNTPLSSFKADGADNSCPDLIKSLLADPTFKSCYPLSMMLQTSNSFFAAERSLVSVTRVLDASCAADSSSCATFLAAAANNISTSSCSQEMQQKTNPVVQAYRGLKAYSLLYTASCLQDPDTSQYCFANAVTDPNAPADSYLYFMPYGQAMPAGSAPSCDWCNQQTMAIYHAAAIESQAFLDPATYNSAATQINAACGKDFVNGTLPAGSTSAAAAAASAPNSTPLLLLLSLASLAAPLFFLS